MLMLIRFEMRTYWRCSRYLPTLLYLFILIILKLGLKICIKFMLIFTFTWRFTFRIRFRVTFFYIWFFCKIRRLGWYCSWGVEIVMGFLVRVVIVMTMMVMVMVVMVVVIFLMMGYIQMMNTWWWRWWGYTVILKLAHLYVRRDFSYLLFGLIVLYFWMQGIPWFVFKILLT